MPTPSKAVLITGCSSGIGRATALRLADAGWNVYASARRPESIADLEQAGVKTLALDVTEESSIRAAVAAVEQAEGAVGVLINNAGYGQSGAIESLPLEAVRRQFETNVFGLLRLTQLVLPRMRAQRWGKVINVGSMGGRLTFPGGGCYHATKHALEAISDALRFELRGFGIDVILLEPGLITTEFGLTAAASLSETEAPSKTAAPSETVTPSQTATPSETVTPGQTASASESSSGAAASGEDPYANFNAIVGAASKGAYEGPLRMLGAGPDRVAKVIEKALARRRPPARITITPSAKLTIATRRLMSDRAWDAAMRRQFPQPS